MTRVGVHLFRAHARPGFSHDEVVRHPRLADRNDASIFQDQQLARCPTAPDKGRDHSGPSCELPPGDTAIGRASWGKSVSVRVCLGGIRVIKKTERYSKHESTLTI